MIKQYIICMIIYKSNYVKTIFNKKKEQMKKEKEEFEEKLKENFEKKLKEEEKEMKKNNFLEKPVNQQIEELYDVVTELQISLIEFCNILDNLDYKYICKDDYN